MKDLSRRNFFKAAGKAGLTGVFYGTATWLAVYGAHKINDNTASIRAIAPDLSERQVKAIKERDDRNSARFAAGVVGGVVGGYGYAARRAIYTSS